MDQDIILTMDIWKILTLLAGLFAVSWYVSSRLSKIETNLKCFDKRLKSLEERFGATEDLDAI